MTERTDHTQDPPDEPTLVTPVMDGAAELQAEADAAVEAGEVHLTDKTYGGPPVREEPADTE